MGRETMIECAERWGLIKSGNTDFEKAKSMGIDFTDAIWDISFVLGTYKKYGYIKANFIAGLLPAMKLGYHRVDRDRGNFLKGIVMGMYLIKSGDVKLEDLNDMG